MCMPFSLLISFCTFTVEDSAIGHKQFQKIISFLCQVTYKIQTEKIQKSLLLEFGG